MHRQFTRYAIVGFCSNVALYAAYLLVTSCGIGHKTAMSLLFALGILLTFLINRRWTFRHCGPTPRAFTRYVAIYGIGYMINLLALYLFVDKLLFPHQIVQGILVIIVALLLFVLQKFWVFGNNSEGV